LPVEIHVVADLVVGAAGVGLDLIETQAKVFHHCADQIAELARTGLDVDARHLGGDRHQLGVKPRVQLVAALVAEAVAQLGKPVLLLHRERRGVVAALAIEARASLGLLIGI